MSQYGPELGQLAFGQPYKEFGVPEIWEAALAAVRDDLDRARRNVHQEVQPCPFGNTGEEWACNEFEVAAYSWNEEVEQPHNFKWGDVEISWYKYLGRGMSANQELSPSLAAEMLESCLSAIREWEDLAGRDERGGRS